MAILETYSAPAEIMFFLSGGTQPEPVFLLSFFIKHIKI